MQSIETTPTTETPRSLALVGMPGSGKTMCALHLASQGFFQFRFGGIVEDEVIRRGLEVNPENERIVREEFRQNEGMDAIAKRALPHLKAALETHNSIIMDGLYSFSEYKLLKPELGQDMVVVALTCPRRLRYERLSQRPVRPLTPQEAEERDWREIDFLEKGGPIAIADYTLVNDRDTDTLLQDLDNLIQSLGLRP
jgi:dephospho-CoA kinase